MGQSRRLSHVRGTSAPPPTPDLSLHRSERRDGPLPDSCTAAGSIFQVQALIPAGPSPSMCSLKIPSFTLGRSCSMHDLRSRRFCRRRGLDETPGGLPSLLRGTKRPFSCRQSTDVDRMATPRGQRPFPTSAIRTRRCGLGIPSYSDRAACKPSHTVQTVIGTEAAPRECRPARRLTAASIGPGPAA